MIYFTEISRDITGKQEKAEVIAFQFYLKELPESIKTPYYTKVNHIEYNGGFVTNQIIGVFPREIEWEGCFYGTYERADGSRYSAKERADEIKKFLGRPIRVGFAMPQGSDDYIAGQDPISKQLGNPNDFLPGRMDSGLGGDVGVYVIEEYEPEIINYSDVNYRIKLTPHQRQEKIKPTQTETIPIKLIPENITNASAAIKKKIKGTRNTKLNSANGNADKAKANGEAMTTPKVEPKRTIPGKIADARAREATAAREAAAKGKPTPAPGAHKKGQTR